MKTENKRHSFVLSGIFIFCLFLFSACGLESYIYINAPTVLNNEAPTYETENAYRYFEFTTNEHGQNDAFLGTAIYYKIYNNRSTMASQISTISSLSSSSTNESAAAAKMIDGFGYVQLGLKKDEKGVTKTPLIEKKGSNQRVRIRLTNYQETIASDSEYKASVTVDGTEIGVPMRVGNRYSFDFGRREVSKWGDEAENNALPEENDALGDVKYSESWATDDSEDNWYVDLYAVGVGMSEDFVSYYSNVLHLGSVLIDSSVEDN